MGVEGGRSRDDDADPVAQGGANGTGGRGGAVEGAGGRAAKSLRKAAVGAPGPCKPRQSINVREGRCGYE